MALYTPIWSFFIDTLAVKSYCQDRSHENDLSTTEGFAMFVRDKEWHIHLSALSIALTIAAMVYFSSIAIMVKGGSGVPHSIAVATFVAFIVPSVVYSGLVGGSRWFPSDPKQRKTIKNRCVICAFSMMFIFMGCVSISVL
jgi:hypothetical protein